MKSISGHRRKFLKFSAAALVGSTAGYWTSGFRAFAADSDGFAPLFDGKTLNGWHLNPARIGHGTGGHWFVYEGAVCGEQDPPGSGNGGVLLTDEKFGDFELLIDMKPDWGVCSGLFLRSNDKGQCFQMLVDYHDAGNVGHIYGEGTGGFSARAFDINGKLDGAGRLVSLTTDKLRGSGEHELVSTCTGDEWLAAWRVHDWNTARVRCEGEFPRITTWINDRRICEFDAGTYQNSQYDKAKVASMLGTSGSIAVQVHGGTGWPKGAMCRWKNIRIKRLA